MTETDQNQPVVSLATKDTHELAPAESERMLTRAEFQRLSDMPPVLEWLANIESENTRRSYATDLKQFMKFLGIQCDEDFRNVKRAHVIAWREHLKKRNLGPATIRRKLSAMADLYDYLCETNAIEFHPVNGVKRPREGINEGQTPALSSEQVNLLLDAPPRDTLKGKRDRAWLSVLAYHAIRRDELHRLCVKHIVIVKGVKCFEVLRKGKKRQFIPAHPDTLELIAIYFEAAGHKDQSESPLFFRLSQHHSKDRSQLAPITGDGYYKILNEYAKKVGVSSKLLGPHCFRTTAAT